MLVLDLLSMNALDYTPEQKEIIDFIVTITSIRSKVKRKIRWLSLDLKNVIFECSLEDMRDQNSVIHYFSADHYIFQKDVVLSSIHS